MPSRDPLQVPEEELTNITIVNVNPETPMIQHNEQTGNPPSKALGQLLIHLSEHNKDTISVSVVEKEIVIVVHCTDEVASASTLAACNRASLRYENDAAMTIDIDKHEAELTKICIINIAYDAEHSQLLQQTPNSSSKALGQLLIHLAEDDCSPISISSVEENIIVTVNCEEELAEGAIQAACHPAKLSYEPGVAHEYV